jgi:nucleolin
MWADGALDNSYMTENPDGITRLFCGNLKKEITEEQLHNAINGITHIKWMTDKVTREFYGSTFVEMKDPKAAAAAVMLDKTKLLGRPLKIYFCPPRPGDVWPPTDQGRGPHNPAPRATKEVQPKPPGCRKLFCGNLAYEIDDEAICHFFKDCGELTGLRWLTRKETGEFRGCAFVEFGASSEADLAIAKNGAELLGRPIRLDWDN